MATLIDNVNCTNVRLGLGLPSCLIQEGRVTGALLIKPSWSFNPVSETWDSTYNLAQIQNGNFVPFVGAVEFTDNTPEPTTEEFQGGLKNVVRNGKQEYMLKFIKGFFGAKAMYSYNSFQAYNFALVFESGAILLTGDTAKVAGVKAGMVNSSSYKFNDGNASGYSTLSFQAMNENEINKDGVLIDGSQFGFDLNDANPIMDVTVTGVAVAGASIVAKVVATANTAVAILGLQASNFRLTINGVVNAVSGAIVDNGDGTYVITPTTPLVAGNIITIQTYDATKLVGVALLGVRLYKGISASITTSVAPVNPLIPVVTSDGVASGTIGSPFTYTITATNTPTSYNVVGILNAGLSFNTSTGVISGTPTGSANIRIVRVEAINAEGTGSKFLEITIS